MLQHLQCYNWITAVELQLTSFRRQLMVNHFYSNLEKSSLLHLFLYRNIYCLKTFPSDSCFSSMSATNVTQGGIKTQSYSLLSCIHSNKTRVIKPGYFSFPSLHPVRDLCALTPLSLTIFWVRLHPILWNKSNNVPKRKKVSFFGHLSMDFHALEYIKCRFTMQSIKENFS